MSQDDVLFGYRLQLVDLAGRVGVTAACRTFGVHRSTYYAWKRKLEREGLGALRPRERRRPRMPNQLSPLLEQRIVAFALGDPGLGPRRIAAELARPRWGGLVVSANGVWRCLCRHGLNTRGKRLSLGAGYAAPYEPPRPAPFEQRDPDPRRPTADKRCSRVRTQDDPRRVLAPGLRPLPPGPLPRPTPRPRRLPPLLQLRARPHRPPHPQPHTRRHRLRCPQDGSEMSRTCRH